MSTEFEIAHEKAIKMNSKYVNVKGHGNRAYELIALTHGIATVRPLSKGIEWSFDSYKIIYPVKEMCTCEHTNHFNDSFGPKIGHEYGKVTAGTKKARFVGPICDDCSVNCLADYLI